MPTKFGSYILVLSPRMSHAYTPFNVLVFYLLELIAPFYFAAQSCFSFLFAFTSGFCAFPS